MVKIFGKKHDEKKETEHVTKLDAVKFNLPSGIPMTYRDITAGEWNNCLARAQQINPILNIPRGDLGYWEKYEEYATGWSRQRLDTLSAEDGKFLRDFSQGTVKIGPNGPRESKETQKK